MEQTTKKVEALEKPIGFIDAFVKGARKGYNLAFNVILPSSIFAFVLIYLFNELGIMNFIGVTLSPIMGIFGLPGQAAVPLLLAYISTSSGVVAAAALMAAGTLSGDQLTIMIPFIFLIGAALQYLGRILVPSGIPTKHFSIAIGIATINAILSMFVMRILLALI